MRHRRKFAYNKVYFVTNRVAYGLPFVCCLYLNLHLFGILARAMFMYRKVIVCAWIFLPNHYHGIVVLRGGPKDMKEFMNYFNGEVGKLVNRLRGVTNRNVWASRYSAQRLAKPKDVLEKLSYIYLNPVKANLVESIEEYPGVSTWHEHCGGAERHFKWVGTAKLKRMPYGPLAQVVVDALVRAVFSVNRALLPLVVQPFAWKACFAESEGWQDEHLRQTVTDAVAREEEALRKKRLQLKRKVLGASALTRQNFFQPYVPKKYSPRPICISSCPELRKRIIAEYRAFDLKCREAWKRWQLGDFSADYPPGAFRPWMPPTASIC